MLMKISTKKKKIIGIVVVAVVLVLSLIVLLCLVLRKTEKKLEITVSTDQKIEEKTQTIADEEKDEKAPQISDPRHVPEAIETPEDPSTTSETKEEPLTPEKELIVKPKAPKSVVDFDMKVAAKEEAFSFPGNFDDECYVDLKELKLETYEDHTDWLKENIKLFKGLMEKWNETETEAVAKYKGEYERFEKSFNQLKAEADRLSIEATELHQKNEVTSEGISYESVTLLSKNKKEVRKNLKILKELQKVFYGSAQGAVADAANIKRHLTNIVLKYNTLLSVETSSHRFENDRGEFDKGKAESVALTKAYFERKKNFLVILENRWNSLRQLIEETAKVLKNLAGIYKMTSEV